MVAKIYFDPPLWLQRQSWVLGKLRQERSDSVVDVGCSNGVLLSALMQPAFQLDQFPIQRFPALIRPSKPSRKEGADDVISDALLSSRHWIYSPNDIVLSRLIGIDVERKVLENAKASLSAHGLALAKNRPRWKSLDVRLFQGPVETENETLDDYDAFVATEIIEHLDEPALQQFAPTVFGKYRPRIVLVTTPNYCFNDNFGQDLKTRPGFPDPTGRTDRVFRHEDHKFEFTPAEFKQWCDTIADDFGYEVHIEGVGSGIYRVPKDQMDPPVPAEQGAKIWHASRPRTNSHADEKLRYATQSAFFVRHSANDIAAGRRQQNDDSAHNGSSHPFSDRFLQSRSVPKPPVETRVHDIFDEAISREGDENEEDGGERGRSGRRARSRRTENLPFLSIPSPQTPVLSSLSTVPNPIVADLPQSSAPPTPFTGHQLVWSHRYDCSLPSAQVAEASKRKIQTAEPLSADEILVTTVEKQRQLYVRGQWHGDDGASSEAGIGKEAVAKLWDVWSDDEVRAACGGRVAVLLDALRLVAAESEAVQATAVASGLPTSPHSSAADRQSTVVGSDGTHWDLRVQTVRHNNVSNTASSPAHDFVESDLFLVYTHPDVARWQASIDEARKWVPHDMAASSRWSSNGRGSISDAAASPVQPMKNASSLNPSWD
ncbi:3'-RNA ribose 2'-O-methyltransferase, Hen1 [Kalmanozyma brasiliensis GHG001]|uniref:Small RNA 2'-O-methyltransferase n=1 Tax=Kalmanozyma brasiliensis (strain GHG001) TaxID=1365824 RepID=V5EQB7_KALBG|nr:3'-RNA ribose 2'-O-methyltransferase, Hen1 [Kalmanozyma brasiliensis GHG001]EST07335.1 3'-RNA ribose 2'-O-methyltransferase, Hen1 [Kalmanozyma brasiliensis GHG001]